MTAIIPIPAFSDNYIWRVPRERDKRDRGAPTVPSTIADERRRARDESVAHARRSLDGPVETFAVLRAWKNDFR